MNRVLFALLLMAASCVPSIARAGWQAGAAKSIITPKS